MGRVTTILVCCAIAAVSLQPVSAAGSDRGLPERVPARQSIKALMERLAPATRERALVDPMLALTARSSGDGIIVAEQPGTTSIVAALPSHDLDGDRRGDVIVLRWEFATASPGLSGVFTLTAWSASGKPMWEHATVFRNGFTVPFEARVGGEGDNGFVLFNPSFGEEVTMETIAVAGDGTERWRNVAAGTYVGVAALGLPWSWALVDSLPGRATDVMVTQIDGATSPVGTITRAVTTMIDGADGSARPHVPGDAGVGMFMTSLPAGDLDGDGLDDYVALGGDGAGEGSITGRRGSDGLVLWAQTSTSWGDSNLPLPVPDATGDGRNDLVLGRTRGRSVALIDGSSGAVVWARRTGEVPYWVGDAGGGRGPDVGVYSVVTARRMVAGFSAFTPQGRRLYATRWTLSSPKGSDRAIVLLDAGDLDGDGSWDTAMRLDWRHPDGRGAGVAALISGRTGGAIGRSVMNATPLGAEVDPGGDDLLRVQRRDASGIVIEPVTIRGRTLWQSGLRSSGIVAVQASAGHTDKDRCAELILAVYSPVGVSLVVMDGGDGRLRWQRSVLGSFSVSKGSVADNNTAC